MLRWVKQSFRWVFPALLFIDATSRMLTAKDIFVFVMRFVTDHHSLKLLVSGPGLLFISTVWLTALILAPRISRFLPLWISIGTTTHLRTWIDERKRHEILQLRLKKCKREEIVRFISFTGKSVLLPSLDPDERLLDCPFPRAVDSGVKFQGILLDPDPTNIEADFRSKLETPDMKREQRLFYRDADSVASLRNIYKQAGIRYSPDQLDFKYFKLGLQFSLWLFNDYALIEPYHVGRRSGNLHLCEFAQMIIPKSDINFRLLEDHFNNLWQSEYTRPVWTERTEEIRRSTTGSD